MIKTLDEMVEAAGPSTEELFAEWRELFTRYRVLGRLSAGDRKRFIELHDFVNKCVSE